LRNTHDPRLDRTVPITIREALQLSTEDFLVICVGNFKPGRAAHQAIESFTQLPPRYKLAFVGSNYPDLEQELEKKHLESRVRFLPARAPDELVPFIRSADVGLISYHDRSANYRYCLPNGFFQSLAAGLPVLYPRLPEIEELAVHYNLGWAIDPLNPASIAAVIHKIGTSPELLEEARINVSNAMDDLSWEHEETKLQALLEELIGRPEERMISLTQLQTRAA
jgi:glycosyltransferase involved in cell wall biosynthesis